MLSDVKSFNEQRINFDGAYSSIEYNYENYKRLDKEASLKPEGYYYNPHLSDPIFFFRDGLVCYLEVPVFESKEYEYYLKDGVFIAGRWAWGVYKISNDTINAFFFVRFSKNLSDIPQRAETHFQGILINRDSLVNWHMVPAYPEVPAYPKNIHEKMLNEPLTDRLKTPRQYCFKPSPFPKYIYSDKAWINKFRDEKYMKRIK